MTTNVGHLYKKKVVRNSSGQIIDWLDEADGGWIIRRGVVINQAKIDEYAKKEEDRISAAKAATEAKIVPPEVADMRAGKPGQVEELEKKVAEQDKKLDLILNLLQKDGGSNK